MSSDIIRELAGQLGLSDKALAKLERKYEDDLESVLAKWWNELQETPRLLGRQGGYVTSSFAAFQASEAEDARRHPEPEAVDAETQRVITMEAHGRWAKYEATEKQDELARRELRGLNQALRECILDAVKAGVDPSRTIEAVRAQIEAQERENERKAA